ncbi:MAG TPA: hypothetical protein VK627_06905 [Edaphobacter sp.]|nr:hypothetical protein [Edaphobacter sp.]
MRNLAEWNGCDQDDTCEEAQGKRSGAVAPDAAIAEDEQDLLPAAATAQAVGRVCKAIFMETSRTPD